MASTPTKRIWWEGEQCEKQCRFPWIKILGRSTPVHPDTVEAWNAFSMVLDATGYDDVYSVWCYNCRLITGGTGYSLHSYGIATDLDPAHNGYYTGWPRFSWNKTKFTPAQVAALYRVKLNNGKRLFLWGGYWNSVKDYMHWEIDVSPSDLAKGVDWGTVAGYEEETEDRMSFLPMVYGDGTGDREFKKSDVAALQSDLNDMFGAALKEDGEYGSKTAVAVTSIPSAEPGGHAVTGKMWSNLQRELMKKYSGKPGVKGDPGEPGKSGTDGKSPQVLQVTEWS